jgi:hypothetical protein
MNIMGRENNIIFNSAVDDPVREELLRSIFYLTGYKVDAIWQPSRLIHADECMQPAMLLYAFKEFKKQNTFFEKGYMPTGYSPGILDVVYAFHCARASFLNTHTVAQGANLADPRSPSPVLFTATVYLHNCAILGTHAEFDNSSLGIKQFIAINESMRTFHTILKKQTEIVTADDVITLHAVVIKFLRFYQDRVLRGALAGKDRPLFYRPTDAYLQLRTHNIFLSLLIEQLVRFSPISRMWFIPAVPYHFPEQAGEWERLSLPFMGTEMTPLLMSLGDYLASLFSDFELWRNWAALFNWQEREWQERYARALMIILDFLKMGTEQDNPKEGMIFFRSFFLYYLLRQKFMKTLDENTGLAKSSDFFRRSVDALASLLHRMSSQTAAAVAGNADDPIAFARKVPFKMHNEILSKKDGFLSMLKVPDSFRTNDSTITTAPRPETTNDR